MSLTLPGCLAFEVGFEDNGFEDYTEDGFRLLDPHVESCNGYEGDTRTFTVDPWLDGDLDPWVDMQQAFIDECVNVTPIYCLDYIDHRESKCAAIWQNTQANYDIVWCADPFTDDCY